MWWHQAAQRPVTRTHSCPLFWQRLSWTRGIAMTRLRGKEIGWEGTFCSAWEWFLHCLLPTGGRLFARGAVADCAGNCDSYKFNQKHSLTDEHSLRWLFTEVFPCVSYW
jgi:hypothetical protein